MSATTYVYISFIINIEFSAYKTDNNIKKHILLSNENHLYKIYNCWCWLYNHFVKYLHEKYCISLTKNIINTKDDFYYKIELK